MKRTSVVYAITNTVSGKVYVGSTTDVRKRFYNHKYNLERNKHTNPLLQNSWNHNGGEAFTFTVLEEVSEDALTTMEQVWIDRFKVEGRELFNVRVVVESSRGMKHSAETLKKMSVALTGKKPSDAARKKMSEAKLGQKKSDETRAKMGAWQVGRKLSQETRNKIAAAARERAERKKLTTGGIHGV